MTAVVNSRFSSKRKRRPHIESPDDIYLVTREIPPQARPQPIFRAELSAAVRIAGRCSWRNFYGGGCSCSIIGERREKEGRNIPQKLRHT